MPFLIMNTVFASALMWVCAAAVDISGAEARSFVNTHYVNGDSCNCDTLVAQFSDWGGYLEEEIPYVNGKINGEIRIYSLETGNLVSKKQIKKGKMDGYYVTFYEDESVSSVEHYANGRRNGISISKYENGFVKDSSFYVNGYLNGAYVEYFNDGKVQSFSFYNKGQLVGYKKCANGRVGNASVDCNK